jgi:hypothetical protein
MPLTVVQMVLGASFALIWVFIGVMIFRDRKLALRDEEESARHASHSRHTMPPRPHANFNQKPAARPHQPSAA